MLGRTHFKEFAAAPEGVATNILTNRLARLLDYELIEKVQSDQVPGKEAYRLTKRGKSLRPVVRSIANWGLAHLDGIEARMQKK